MPSAAIKEHWSRVAALGCIVSGYKPATIHHIHGGSVVLELGFEWQPGGAQKQNDWLVIPLAPEYHTGAWGIDNGTSNIRGVDEWEAAFGTQMEHLREVSYLLGYNVLEKAGYADRER